MKAVARQDTWARIPPYACHGCARRDILRAMASEQVEIMHRAFAAWNRGDFDAVLPFIHPAVEWRTSGEFPGLEPVYRGHEGFRLWWDALRAPWERFTIDVERTLEVGDCVVTGLRFHAIGKESGARVELTYANLFRLEAGVVVSRVAYRSVDEALAGLDRGE